ncbi:MAG: hypothetical protein ABMA64_41090, partial [Myxococcota bacterium]
SEAPPAEPAPEDGPVVVAPTEEPAVEEPAVELPPDYRSELRYGLALELGSLANNDPAFDWFADGNSIGSVGVRAGFRPAAWLEARLGWHGGRRGSTVGTGDATYDLVNQESTFRAALTSHQGMAGVRVDATYDNALYAYVAADALLYAGRIRLDDDPTVDSNPGQVQVWGVAPGVAALGGVEVRIPPGLEAVQFAWNLELGYAYYPPVQFDRFGAMQPGGFTARSGLAVWF